jgi:hypothetical protein
MPGSCDRYAGAMRPTVRTEAAYDALLASIGERSADIDPRPLVSHWPHVGSAYRGLVIVGQALRGWPDEWPASEARIAAGRQRILNVTARSQCGPGRSPRLGSIAPEGSELPLLDL